MRLHIILSGVYHAVAMLHLTRPAIKRLQQNHPTDWRSRLGLLTVGPKRKQLLPEFLRTGGYTPRVDLLRRGMLLQAKHFGIEVTVNGAEEIPEQLDSRQRETELLPMLRGFGEDDLLGVFQMQVDAALTLSWEEAPEFDSRLILLRMENIGPVINEKERFDLIREVTYAGAPPSSRRLQSLGTPRMLKHIFHVPRQS